MFAAKVYLASLYGSLRIHLSPNRCRNRRDVVPCDLEFWNRSKRPLNSFRMRGGAGWEEERKGIKENREGQTGRKSHRRSDTAVQKKNYGNVKVSSVIRSKVSEEDHKRSQESLRWSQIEKLCEIVKSNLKLKISKCETKLLCNYYALLVSEVIDTIRHRCISRRTLNLFISFSPTLSYSRFAIFDARPCSYSWQFFQRRRSRMRSTIATGIRSRCTLIRSIFTSQSLFSVVSNVQQRLRLICILTLIYHGSGLLNLNLTKNLFSEA